MSSRAHTIPEIRVILLSFNFVPHHDEGIMRMARGDIGRMKKATKAKNAISRCNAYRVWRSQTEVKIEFLDTEESEEGRVRLRMIYQLSPPFA